MLENGLLVLPLEKYKRVVTIIPVFKMRNTISSRAEFDGAQTSTLRRYLRLELTTSGFCRAIKVRR